MVGQKKYSALYARVIRKLAALASRHTRNVRRHVLNFRPGINIARTAIIAPSVEFEIDLPEAYIGGTITIGENSRLSVGVVLTPYKGDITLHENVFLGPYVVIAGQGGVEIGKNTIIAGHTFIVAGCHRFNGLDVPIYQQGISTEGIKIGSDVWIGCGVRVLDGVSIGNGCVVGAGAVVTKSLSDYSVAVGVPARIVGNRNGLN